MSFACKWTNTANVSCGRNVCRLDRVYIIFFLNRTGMKRGKRKTHTRDRRIHGNLEKSNVSSNCRKRRSAIFSAYQHCPLQAHANVVFISPTKKQVEDSKSSLQCSRFPHLLPPLKLGRFFKASSVACVSFFFVTREKFKKLKCIFVIYSFFPL